MKTVNLVRIAICSFLLCFGAHAKAQSWKDLLNKVTDNSTVQDLVEDLTGSNKPTDIVGTWEYSGAAVGLESENFLKNVAADVAVNAITEKLNPYLNKIGLRKGSFSYQFSSNKSFSTHFKDKQINGTYSLDASKDALTLSYGKSLKLLKMSGKVDRDGDRLKILFPADKLVNFLELLSTNAKDESLSALLKLCKQYDGVYLGFELTLKK